MGGRNGSAKNPLREVESQSKQKRETVVIRLWMSLSFALVGMRDYGKRATVCLTD